MFARRAMTISCIALSKMQRKNLRMLSWTARVIKVLWLAFCAKQDYSGLVQPVQNPPGESEIMSAEGDFGVAQTQSCIRVRSCLLPAGTCCIASSSDRE